MRPQERGEFAVSTPRNMVIPVALTLTLGIAVITAVFYAAGDEDDESTVEAPALEPMLAPAEEAPPAEPVRPAERSPAPAPPRPAPSAPVQTATSPAPRRASEEQEAPQPLTPEVRQHAKQMVIGLAQDAMERGNIVPLESLLQFSQEKSAAAEQSFATVDIEAITLALGCLKGLPEAQNKAAAFLQFGPRSQLDDGVRKSCWEKLGQGQTGG